MELSKNYDAAEIEPRWYQAWLEKGSFHAEPSAQKPPYVILIPPPNVTGILHMGHALNVTLQDVLIRWRRMLGDNALWLPGTDHAGIATQNVVERALKKDNLTREDLGREAFLQRVWQWREQSGGTIIAQLKKLGCACDWERERFTMDASLSAAVVEVFVRLYEKGLIYKGNYIINWCPRCRTALADEESEHQDVDGKLYYIRYAIKDRRQRQHLTVATTRPETMLGDVALAVHSGDDRYRDLIGRKVLLPFIEREIVVIADDFVDPKFGTGVVKVTPAHDPNDFAMGLRHNLPPVNVMNEDGTMNEDAGAYAGLDRFECRRRLLVDLEAANLLERVEPHAHAVGHCYRCHTIVEPRLSLQWFVKMKPLARPAIDAVRDGRIRFTPDRWTKVYLDWMENIRDWCISRQIWWGHRIPVYYCDRCDHEWAARQMPESCPECGATAVQQDPDVLDTWFSSWLWPFSTLGWPEHTEDLKAFYPSNTLVTASEIIFFWVARMIMAGFEFMGAAPFQQVLIHGTVRDDHGRKMSKSLGNSIDPLTIVEQFSADALRFSLMMITATGQDVYLSNDKFEIGRNFATKLWNAARYLSMQTGDAAPACADPSDGPLLTADDRHLVAKLNEAINLCQGNLEKLRFNEAVQAIYEFTWRQFCDWYVEYSKHALYGDDPERRRRTLALMHTVFSATLRLLHPFMPFVTEELWHVMGYGAETDSILDAPWPQPFDEATLAAWGVDRATTDYVDARNELIRTGRNLRADYSIAPAQKIDFIIKPADASTAVRLQADAAALMTHLRAVQVRIDLDFRPDGAVPSGVGRVGAIYMPVEGLIDVAAEIAKLTAQQQKAEQELERVNRKLSNEGFIGKAPPEVVDGQKRRKSELLDTVRKIKRLVEMLKD